MAGGVVPEMIYATQPGVVPEQAGQGRRTDVTDVVEIPKSKMPPVAPALACCHNNVEKKRSYYGILFKGTVVPFHIWGSLVDKAGYEICKRIDAIFAKYEIKA